MVVDYEVRSGVDPACPQPAPIKPDLVISEFDLGTFIVKNVGAGPAGPFTVTVGSVEDFSIPGLAPGASAGGTFNDFCEGLHVATADSRSQVDERDEANNVATFTRIC